MEGYLIRLPACAWGSDDVVEDSGGSLFTSKKGKRSRRSSKPQARLLYYVLGEGFLEGFASPDDVEPIESLQLTSFHVEVEPVYSMLMFRVTTREKKPAGQLLAPAPAITGHFSDDSSDDEANDDSSASHSAPVARGSASAGSCSSLLLFAGNKVNVEIWGKKVLNWNRYVFAGGDTAEHQPSDLVKAKTELITAFHDQNNRGVFAMVCHLDDATAEPSAIFASVSCDAVAAQESSFQQRSKPQADADKPVAADIKPLWMLLNRNASRRISAIPDRE